MDWTTPAFEEINMSAEIGAYQGDEDGDTNPPFVTPSERASASEA
jgi:coenzyme PQQ precursor peptide PqqA